MAAGAVGAESELRMARGPVGMDLASPLGPSELIEGECVALLSTPLDASDFSLRVAATSWARFSSASFSRSFLERNFGCRKKGGMLAI